MTVYMNFGILKIKYSLEQDQIKCFPHFSPSFGIVEAYYATSSVEDFYCYLLFQYITVKCKQTVKSCMNASSSNDVSLLRGWLLMECCKQHDLE